MIQNKCNFCNSKIIHEGLNFGKHPGSHFLWEEKDNKTIQNYDITLGFCENCNLVQLLNSGKKQDFYDDYYPSSWKPQNHIADEIKYLKENMNLSKDSSIIEIGSNDGIFLQQLKLNGFRNLLGLEPALIPREYALKKGIETLPIYISKKEAETLVKNRGKFDLVVLRQVCEHIEDLDDLAKSIKCLLKINGKILVEVPNFREMLENLDYSAIWEQHLNYFTDNTLSNFIYGTGSEIERVKTYNFSGGCLVIFGKRKEILVNPKNNRNSEIETIKKYFTLWDTFKREFIQFIHSNNTIVYGVGCRSIPLLRYTNTINEIDFYVDDNKSKQNRMIPNTNKIVRDISSLKEIKGYNILLAVNHENEEKVIFNNKLIFKRNKVFSLNPPSTLIPKFWNKLI
tara:strand:- start:1184 stop:2377 length:1194 start_codon:yes stop_codon:yes gene_type:complete